jgi:hypothetical protein
LRRWAPQKTASKKHLLGVMGIFKNEAFNIVEWIEHYLGQGAEHIYLIDNDSSDNGIELIDPWVRLGKVSVIRLTKRHKQRQYYWKAFKRYRIAKTCKWLLVADLDEFWFCKDGTPISNALADYEDVDVIYANWSVFGSCGYQNHPKSLRRELTKRQPNLGPDVYRKWICRTSSIKRFRQLHIHKIKHARRIVSDNSRFQINHYVTQSIEYFQTVKMTRGDCNSAEHDATRNMAYFNEYDAPCVVEDRLLADMVESPLRKSDSSAV